MTVNPEHFETGNQGATTLMQEKEVYFFVILVFLCFPQVSACTQSHIITQQSKRENMIGSFNNDDKGNTNYIGYCVHGNKAPSIETLLKEVGVYVNKALQLIEMDALNKLALRNDLNRN